MRLPRLVVADGSVEALKWLALLLMTGDHVNKYLFNGTVPLLFNAGRLALPIFCFVLAYNLARPDTLQRGVYRRTLKRLALFGLAATPAFLALGGLWAGWWPLNVMFTLLAATAVLFLIDQGGRPRLVAAAAVFLVAGSSVEYWWPALSICLAVWWYCRKPSVPALALLLASCAALWFINGNFWALAALPVVAAAAHVDVRLPRLRWAFYAYYPLHLVALWLIRIPMSKAGYLFSDWSVFMFKPCLLALSAAFLVAAQSASAQPMTEYGRPVLSGVFVSFPHGGTAFRPTARQEAELLNAKDADLVTIKGRTSTLKPSAQDESLALARALSARSYLIARGVSPLKIVVNFASAADFIADNSTPEGRLENQRVEVELVFVGN